LPLKWQIHFFNWWHFYSFFMFLRVHLTKKLYHLQLNVCTCWVMIHIIKFPVEWTKSMHAVACILMHFESRCKNKDDADETSWLVEMHLLGCSGSIRKRKQVKWEQEKCTRRSKISSRCTDFRWYYFCHTMHLVMLDENCTNNRNVYLNKWCRYLHKFFFLLCWHENKFL